MHKSHKHTPGSHTVACCQVSERLESANALAGLLDLFQTIVQQLDELSGLVAEPLTDVERRILIALITIDVHNRSAAVCHAFGGMPINFELDQCCSDRNMHDLLIEACNACILHVKWSPGMCWDIICMLPLFELWCRTQYLLPLSTPLLTARFACNADSRASASCNRKNDSL